MKKILPLALAGCLLAAGMTGCKGGAQLKNDMDIHALTDGFWQEDVVYNETVMLIKDGSGPPVGRLLFPAAEIYAVKDTSLRTVYKEGEDYRLEDGALICLEGSSMPFMDRRMIDVEIDLEGDPVTPVVNGNCQEKKGGGYLLWTEGTGIFDRQISVTYRRSGAWEGPVPDYVGDKLPKTMEKLRQKDKLGLLVFGDSIATGANSSSYLGVYPDMPAFPELTAMRLGEEYGAEVVLSNESKGGTLSDWGAKNIASAVLKHRPDLVLIAFGMNDGSWDVADAVYKRNTLTMIERTREICPDAEFLLVGTMAANPEAANQSKDQQRYFASLQALSEEQEGVAAVDVGQLHLEMLKRKEYIDMSANNINHPNDFMARVYAMVLSAALIPN